MEELTLLYKGSITLQHPPQCKHLNASRFERGYLRVHSRRGPGWDETEPFGIYGGTHGSDDQGSETPVDAALIGFLERHKDVLAVAIESDLRARLPRDCRVSVELSFWQGSVAFAATIVLFLVGKHYATREVLKYIRVVSGPSVARVLRHAVATVAEMSTSINLVINLDPSSVSRIEQIEAQAHKRIDRFERRTDLLTKHVYYKGIAMLLAGLFVMAVALAVGAPMLARWYDAVRAVGH